MTNPIKAIIVFGIVALTLLMCLKYGCSPKQSANDVDYKAMYNVATKQNGYLKAQFAKELEIRDKSDKILRAENIALHEQTQLIQGKYSTLVNRIKYTAPIEVQPYIDSVDTECNKVIVAKDNEIGKLAQIVINQDSIVLTQMEIIGVQTVQRSIDSTHIAGLNRHIEALDSEVEQHKRKAKVARFVNKLILTAALVYTGVVVYLTSGE